MKNKKIIALLGTLLLTSMGLSACSSMAPQSQSSRNFTTHKIQENPVGGISQKEYDYLSKLDYKSGSNAIVLVNNNNSTLNKQAWQKSKIDYQPLDWLNRASKPTTAFLDKDNLAKQNYRTRQIYKPTGWHGNRPGAEIYNRGHLIAYSLSGGINKWGKYTGRLGGDQNNPKNLFTQTAYSNQNIQTYYESAVREALISGEKVIYQATPIFRKNELMARGINLQAVTTDGMLNFNVYIYNVQPGYKFNYQSGRVTRDSNMKVRFNQ